MTGFPGHLPIHGDRVQLVTDITSVTITGSITCQGVTREGRGYVELTLPDADPQQRRELERAKWVQYKLFRNSTMLYVSPHLTLSEIRRAKDGALVLSGSP
ncbi:hypothetical protein [Streptomyces sp. NPDC101455]|uniref:hypothetical protein n=1 Tax=Streptomyces sp. NPDC101455 TaxID=3366142 RepID=UPI003803BFE4